MNKFPALLIAALVATCAFSVVAASGKATEEVASTVTIKFEAGGSAPYYEQDQFKGKVKGDEGCKKDRRVKVVKEGGGVVGKDDTNESGRYSVPASNPTGDFFAKVKKATIEKNNGDKIKCLKAKSDSISVP